MQGTCSWYWSSSHVEDYGYDAWGVGFYVGTVYDSNVDYVRLVRCVRDAP